MQKDADVPWETVPLRQELLGTDSKFALRRCDHLRRPGGAHEPFRARTPTRKLDCSVAGAQIITRSLKPAPERIW